MGSLGAIKRFRFEIDYEGPLEWSIGVAGRLEPGAPATNQELAHVMRVVASSLEREFGTKKALPVVYPSAEAD